MARPVLFRLRGIAKGAVCFALGVFLPLSASVVAQGVREPAVTVSAVEFADLRPRFDFNGRLVASQKVEIRARVTGSLEGVGFTEGEPVEAGALLYRIEDDGYQAAVQAIKGSIAAAEAERRLAEIERDRKAQLVDRQAVARSELDIAVANLAKIEGEIERLQAELDRAKLDLSYTQVLAPFSGTVGLTSFDQGAFVGPESGALTTLTRLDPMTAEFPVATSRILPYLRSRAAGDAAAAPMVSLLLPDGTTYADLGEIDFVDAEVASGTDTVKVRAVFPNPDGVLLDGGLVAIELESGEAQLSLSVPQRAVQRDQAGAFVLVVDDGSTVELRRVSVGNTIGGRTIIREGLAEGEQVIVDGVNKVRPGIKVDAAVAGAG